MKAAETSSVLVRFFASLREATGKDELRLPVEAPCSVEVLLDRLSRELPAAAMQALRAENVRLAVNQTLMSGNQPIQPGDEVAFLPPVTGG
jgi:molybdopterin synthase sulfur carrier subunit